jgi:hypothetical protein
MSNKSQTNLYEDSEIQIDNKTNRKIFRIKRTARSTRQKPTKARSITKNDCAGATGPKKMTSGVVIHHTFSFENDLNDDNDKVSYKNTEPHRHHLVRMMMVEKRKAVNENDSTEFYGYRKRVKIDEDDNVHGCKNKSDNYHSKFKPDRDLIISWL